MKLTLVRKGENVYPAVPNLFSIIPTVPFSWAMTYCCFGKNGESSVSISPSTRVAGNPLLFPCGLACNLFLARRRFSFRLSLVEAWRRVKGQNTTNALFSNSHRAYGLRLTLGNPCGVPRAAALCQILVSIWWKPFFPGACLEAARKIAK